MNKWFTENFWSLVIGGFAVVSSYSIYGYRISALEAQVAINTEAIRTQQNNNEQVQVELAQIETDVQYIKAYLSQSSHTFPDVTTSSATGAQ